MCCRRCGALMRVIALIEKPDIIEPILKYLDRWRISYRPVYRANVRFGSLAAPQKLTSSTAAIGGEAAASYKPPRQPSLLIVCFVSIPSLPNLISQFLIHQQSFDVDLGEHGLRVARSWTYCLAKRTAVDSVHLQAIHGPAAPAIFDQPICRLISTPCATRNP